MATAKNTGKDPKRKRKLKQKTIWTWLFITAAIAVFCALAGYLIIILSGEKLYRENLNKLDLAEASIIFDVQGQAVTKLYTENRELVDLNEIPENLSNAFIATEDRRFEEHQGVDLWALGRALVKDVIHRSAVEGGSTITQQLAKNLYLSSDKTIFRKATEVSIAIALENNLTKDEILQTYLNRIYFGKGAYGVKAAAKRYFHSSLDDLKLWQIATLAGIPKAPTHYNPIDNPENSLQRRNVVLKLMYDQGYITAAEKAEASEIKYKPVLDSKNTNYTTYIDYVINEATEVTGLTEDQLMQNGYQIYTRMDSKAQKTMEAAFQDDSLFPDNGTDSKGEPLKVQGAMTIVNNSTGGIVAMVGGRDVQKGDLNRAIRKRPPGSSFKPISVYAPALETGDWNPNSMLNDEKQCFGDYCPRNNRSNYRGEVTMTEAVKKSINIPAVWLLNEIGVKSGYNFAKNIGIKLEDTDRNLAIALGGLTKGASTLEMAQAYSAFASQGRLNKAHAIIRIVESDGREIYNIGEPKAKQVMSAQTAYYMTKMLEGVVRDGSGTKARIDRPVAGKTGTAEISGSSRNSNIWFAGYTAEWTAAVYMGFDETSKKNSLDATSKATAKMFAVVMKEALEDRPVKRFVKPSGVVDITEQPASVKDLAGAYSAEEKTVTLSWSPKEGDVEYRVYRKEASEQDFALLETTKSTQVQDLAIVQGTSYQYYVIVYLPAGNLESKPSTQITINVPVEEAPPIVDPINPDGETGPDGELTPIEPGNPAEIPDDNSGGTIEIPNNGGSENTGAGNGSGEENGNNPTETPQGNNPDVPVIDNLLGQ